MSRIVGAIAVSLLLSMACTSTDEGFTDTGAAADTAKPQDTRDTYTPPMDTYRPPDTARPDTAQPDTRPPDTGQPDTRDTYVPPDTGQPDTGPTDTGQPDTGQPDTGPTDTGQPDTGQPDTGPTDTGPADTGQPDAPDTAQPDTGPTTCPYVGSDQVTHMIYSTIFRDETYVGAGNNVVFDNNLCSDNPDSIERVYAFDLHETTDIYVKTDCGWDCEIVITKDGCSSAHVVECVTTIGEEEFGATLGPGFYYLFVEGDNPDDPAAYDIMININHTSGQDPCMTDWVIDDLMVAQYCCDPTWGSPRYQYLFENEETKPDDLDDFFVNGIFDCTDDSDHIGGGPDLVYEFQVTGTENKDVEINVAPKTGWDLMAYVTTSPCGAMSSVLACDDDWEGLESNISLNLAPGTYYLIVDGTGTDTWQGEAWGQFDLEFIFFDDACNNLENNCY